LISFGIDQAALYRLAVSYVDRILKGEKPADLPVQAPTKYEPPLRVDSVTSSTRIGFSVHTTIENSQFRKVFRVDKPTLTQRRSILSAKARQTFISEMRSPVISFPGGHGRPRRSLAGQEGEDVARDLALRAFRTLVQRRAKQSGGWDPSGANDRIR
jgi:hypothetical protein